MRLLTVILALVLAVPSNAKPEEIEGLWATQDGEGHIGIERCSNDRYCGRLVWFAETEITDSLDVHNRNVSLRNRPLLGILILNRVSTDADTTEPGTIYNPLDGKTFNAWIRLPTVNELRVTGCLGPLCRSNTWLRVGN